MDSSDHVIIGAGAIGLSLACELATHGHCVQVLDKREARWKTSWAAAGILPAVSRTKQGHDDLERLRSLSWQLYPAWADRLCAESGIDIEFRRCGGLHLARGVGEAAALVAAAAQWRDDGVAMERLVSAEDWRNVEPAVAPAVENGDIRAGYLLPDEGVVRTPRLLKALRAACRRRAVGVAEHSGMFRWQTSAGRIEAVETEQGTWAAEQFIVAAGAWSAGVVRPLGLRIELQPRRGQMLLLRCRPRLVRRVINEGPNYLVPRADGRLLVGSTVEDVGFDLQTTEAASDELRGFAQALIPELRQAELEVHWAGLRPTSGDGRPFLGRVPDWDNLFLATGHFRSGIFLAPATARVMSQLVRAEATDVDLSSFQVSRK